MFNLLDITLQKRCDSCMLQWLRQPWLVHLHSLHVSELTPQGSSVSTKLTKQLDVTGGIIKLHFAESMFPPPLLSLSTSNIRSSVNSERND